MSISVVQDKTCKKKNKKKLSIKLIFLKWSVLRKLEAIINIKNGIFKYYDHIMIGKICSCPNKNFIFSNVDHIKYYKKFMFLRPKKKYCYL